MPITRTFLDWSRPALPTVVDYLLEGNRVGDRVDLSNYLIVVPGGRAGRRLLEILVDEAAERGLIVDFPEIVTQGVLPERFYREQKPFANDLTQHLAWIHALQQADRETLRPYFPHLPDDERFESWLPLAQMLTALHRELAADAHDFGDVVAIGETWERFPEADRWRALQQIQAAYLHKLDTLKLWDKQTARLFAIKHGECQTDKQVLLVGAVDLNRTARQMLDQIAGHVTALIFAPPEHAHRFDEHGCLKPALWPYPLVDPADDSIRLAARPGDQADEVLRTLSDFDGAFAAEQIVIGIPDEQLLPYLEQRLTSAGIENRYGPGRTLRNSGWGRLLQQVAEWLDDGSFAATMNLLRHPLVERALVRRGVEGDWLTELDQYRLRHLPTSFGPPWLGEETHTGLIRRCDGWLREILADWRYVSAPPAEWEIRLTRLLTELWAPQAVDAQDAAERETLMGAIRGAFETLQEVPAELTPDLSGAGYLRWLLAEIGREPVPPATDPHAVELLGWLELPWDDAPAMIVTGMNEGIVPSSLNSDLFLPNRLRQQLQLDDNDRRFARDAYALTLLAASRDRLTLVVGRVSAQNDPLVPSRLLFGSDRETLVRRTQAFFRSATDRDRRRLPGTRRPGQSVATFSPPRIEAYAAEPVSMKVTEFKDYLQCPYRYFLRHRLKLKSVISTTEELDGGAFGTMLHYVLEEFGATPEIRTSRSADEITRFLNATLDRTMARTYGKDPEPVIRLQTERMRARLIKFATWQADWASQGWTIEHVERDIRRDHHAEFDVDGTPVMLRGRIDRIDLNLETGARTVFDYKSSEKAKTPEQAHVKRTKAEGLKWIDLQLPLYRHLVRALGIEETPQLAYINLPGNLDSVGHVAAQWSEGDLETADERARQIIRDIRNNIFWPPSDDGGLMAEFAEICLESVNTLVSDDGEEDA